MNSNAPLPIKRRHTLSWQVIRFILLLGILFTVSLTAVELWLAYEEAHTELDRNLDLVMESFLPAIAESVYTVDQEQLEAQLEGILSLPYISYIETVEIRRGETIQTSRGEEEGEGMAAATVERSAPLMYTPLIGGDEIELGRLTVAASLVELNSNLWLRARNIIISQLVNVILISMLLLFVFQTRITRHITRMAQYLQKLQVDDLEDELTLERPEGWFSPRNEIDLMKVAINDVRVRLRDRLQKYEGVERSLRTSEAFVRTILDNLSDQIAVLDQDGTVILANRAMEAEGKNGFTHPLIGLREGANFWHILQVLQAGDALRSIKQAAGLLADAVEEILNGRCAATEFEYAVGDAGQQRWYFARVAGFQRESQTAVIISHQEITADKLAEETLRISEDRYRKLFEFNVVGVFITNFHTGQLIEINERMRALFGIRVEDIAHTSMIQFYREITDRDGILARLKREGVVEDLEILMINREGREFWANVSATRFDYHGREAILGTIVDVTEKKKRDEELKVYQNSLEALVDERTKELNLRIAEVEGLNQGIINLAEDLQATNNRLVETSHELEQRSREQAAAEERQKLARDLHDVVSQSLFSASIIAETLPRLWESRPELVRENLSELHRLNRGALAEMRALLLELRPSALEDLRLEDLIRQLTEGIRGRDKFEIEFIQKGHLDLPVKIKINLYRLAQEALNNIARHAQATAIKIELIQRPEQISLAIRDNGRGIDLDLINKGRLGLKIMRERIENLDGIFTITSKPGEGTLIKAEVPLLLPEVRNVYT